MLVGIDIVENSRMEHLFVDRFFEKYFSNVEENYSKSRPNPIETLSGLYASKEAFLKALGIGIGGGIDLKEIEIEHYPSGKPYIRLLSDNANKKLSEFGVQNIDLSISHSGGVTTAICILI